MTTFTADPYVIRLPEKITNPDGSPSNEFQQWLNYDNRWKHDIWVYSGAGENVIGESNDQIEINKQNIETNQTNITNVNANLNALTVRVTENESDIADLQGRAFSTFNLSANHTTSGNEILNFKNTTAIDITLNATPEDQETIHYSRDGSGRVNFIGTVNGDTNFYVKYQGSGGTLYYSSDLGEWRRR
jgi:hypothetical protein